MAEAATILDRRIHSLVARAPVTDSGSTARPLERRVMLCDHLLGGEEARRTLRVLRLGRHARAASVRMVEKHHRCYIRGNARQPTHSASPIGDSPGRELKIQAYAGKTGPAARER